MTKVKSKMEVILEARKRENKNICHLNNAEPEPKCQKYKGPVAPRGDIEKDDSGSCTVFTEQVLSVCVDDIKMAGGNEKMGPIWKKLMKLVDLGEPTSFLDHVCLGCTQRECKPNETIIDEYRKMFEPRISAGASENCQGVRNLTQKLSRGHTIWKVMRKMRGKML